MWQSGDPILEMYLPTGDKEQDTRLAGIGGVYMPANLALYGYSHLNPIRLRDPDGNQTEDPNESFYREIMGENNPRDYARTLHREGAEAMSKTGDAMELTYDVAAGGGALGTLKAGKGFVGWLKGLFSTKADDMAAAGAKVLARPRGVPDNWVVTGTKKGGGTQYINPKNPHDRVRVMPGNPNSPNPAQQNPYVKRQIDGKFYDASGNVVPGDSPEAHIPLEKFEF